MNASRNRWLGLFAILAATIMNLLDSTVINVAGPAIQTDLGATYSDLQWIAAAYTLALAVGLLTGGRLGDMFGRRRMLLIGITGFVAASMLCALAFDPYSLIGARVLQGLFGAVMIPQGFGLIRDLFPPQEIGKAFAAFGPVIGLSTIAGPIVAGALVSAYDWRMVFAINLPLGLFSFIVGMRNLPAGEVKRGRLDLVGAALAGAGMVLVIYPLVQDSSKWYLAAGLAVLAVFAVQQLRSKKTPLVELSVFTRRSYLSGVAFVIVFFGAIVGFSLAIGMLLQLGMGQSPMKASLTMSGWAVGAFLGSAFGAMMMHKLGRNILHLGLAIMALGILWLYQVLPAQSGFFWPLLVFGAGMGMIFVPLFDIIMGEIKDHEVGSASSILESLQQMGASLGVAVLGSVFFSVAGVQGEFVAASQTVTLIALGLTVLTFGLGFLLPRKARAMEFTPAASPSPSPELVGAAA